MNEANTQNQAAVAGSIETLVCHTCNEVIESTAGDPSKWPLFLPFMGGNGTTRPYHFGCVIQAVDYYEKRVIPACAYGCSADGYYYDENCPVHEPDPWFGTHIREAIRALRAWWAK